MERHLCVPNAMHQGLPWAVLPCLVTTVSWSTVATWFSAHGETVSAHCSAEDIREECKVGGPQPVPENLQIPLNDDMASGPGASRTKENIDTGSLRRRYGSNATAGNSSSGGDGGASAPQAGNSSSGVDGGSDYYDDLFHRIINLVSELLGRAAVASLKYLWTALDWFGLWVMGTWWIKLKWMSVILIAVVFASCVAVLGVLAFMAIRGAVQAGRWSLYLLKRFSVGEVTAHEVRVAAGDPTVTTIAWTGPDCATQCCAAYVTGDIKGRGENRLANDLLIKVDGGVARLGRGQLRGRVARHGYLYYFTDIRGCSHRSLRQKLEATRVDGGDGSVHLVLRICFNVLYLTDVKGC